MKRGHYTFFDSLKALNFPEMEGVFYSQKSKKWVVRIKNLAPCGGNFIFKSIAQFKKESDANKYFTELKKQ